MNNLPDVDYKVVKKDGEGVLLEITSSDGRATPDLEALFNDLSDGRPLIVRAQRRRTESTGLFVGHLRFDPVPRRSWFSLFSLLNLRRRDSVLA